MNVKQLIEELSYFDEDTDVHFLYPAGDYWHSQVATEVTCLDLGDVEYNERLMDFKVADGCNDKSHQVVLLS